MDLNPLLDYARVTAGDPRPSLEEPHGTAERYACVVRRAKAQLLPAGAGRTGAARGVAAGLCR